MSELRLTPCTHAMAMGIPFKALHDEECAHVHDLVSSTPVIDTHVHLFPPRLFDAIWRWFDQYGWPIRYRLYAEEVIAFLRAHGVHKFVAMLYAHKKGIASSLNQFMYACAQAHRDTLIPLGTVLPKEPSSLEDAREALYQLDLHGLKLHCHVQRFSVDDEALWPIYALCVDSGKPILIHAGREPQSPAYGVDAYAICNVKRVERVLQAFPTLKLVVPHLGMDEVTPYCSLLSQYENLWLDTTMAIADFFPTESVDELVRKHARRLLYGTDFPNLPYAWSRELRKITSLSLESDALNAILYDNARRVFAC